MLGSVIALALMVQATVSGLPIMLKTPVYAETSSVETQEKTQQPTEENPGSEIISSGNVEYEDWTVSASTPLTGTKEVKNLNIKSGTLDLNGHTLIVHGDVVFSGGKITFNKGKLECENFTMNNSNANLVMTNENDYILVKNNFTFSQGYFNSSNAIAGTIEVQGNFSATTSRFSPSLEQKVLLSGEEEQTISLSSDVGFNILDIQNLISVYSVTPIKANKIIGNLDKTTQYIKCHSVISNKPH
jgi:hypothetical protein